MVWVYLFRDDTVYVYISGAFRMGVCAYIYAHTPITNIPKSKSYLYTIIVLYILEQASTKTYFHEANAVSNNTLFINNARNIKISAVNLMNINTVW